MSDRREYDFVEIGGSSRRLRGRRSDGPFTTAKCAEQCRRSAPDQSCAMKNRCRRWYAETGKPLSERSHHLLHTDINAWQMPQKS